MAALQLLLSGMLLGQEQTHSARDSVQAGAAQAESGARESTETAGRTAGRSVVQFPEPGLRLMIAFGGVVLFGGLALVVDRLRRRADARAGLDNPNAI